VLVPEATFQLLLWHRGERGTPEVQGDEEEARLRARGEALSAETDWVRGILRRREAVLQAGKKRGAGAQDEGRRGRRRGG
jgi:hypothetical protein